MLKFHPSIVTRNGRKEFVLLPFEEYAQLEELMQDAFDIRQLRRARKTDKSKPSLTLEQVKKKLGL